MDHPVDLNRPFFAYGIFRPGELGFFQLREFVGKIEKPGQVTGCLRLRDGLPILDRAGSGMVTGTLLHFATAQAATGAYDRITALEPGKQYRWEEIPVSETIANVLIGRSPRKGSVDYEGSEWDSWKDPLFTSALDVVEEMVESQEQFEWDLKPLFRLQMAYLLLWSSIERYVSLRYHFGDDATKKVGNLASETAFRIGLKDIVAESRNIYRADRPDEKEVLDPQSPEKALKYYYQVRSNITHRGKGVVHDHERLLKSASELLSLFRRVLKAARADAATTNSY